jgi:hypothetical protein
MRSVSGESRAVRKCYDVSGAVAATPRTNGVRSGQRAATVTTFPLGRWGCPVWRFIGNGNGSRG